MGVRRYPQVLALITSIINHSMKTYLIIGTAVLAIVAVLVGVIVSNTADKADEALQGISAAQQSYVLAGSKNATSSAISYSNIATTTDPSVFTTRIGYGVDGVDLNLCVVASSTTARVDWTYDYSNDGVNYFNYDNASTSGDVLTHAVASSTNQWTPTSTSQKCRNVVVRSLNAEYMRVTFTRGAAFQNYNLFAELTTKDGDGN